MECMDVVETLDRYVIATFDNPTTYLSRVNGEYYFIDNLVGCTKFTSRKTAEQLKRYFYKDTGLNEIELVVLPLKIEYKLINELNEIGEIDY